VAVIVYHLKFKIRNKHYKKQS